MRALIICNGFPPPFSLLSAEAEQADLIIGADGGGNILLSYKITPHIVIGDMDSFRQPPGGNIPTLFDADQETNDLEKALDYAVEQKATSCTVLGAFGKRLDHSLKNLSVMMRYYRQFDELVLKDEYQRAYMVGDYFEAQAKPGTIVSLFPITGRVSGIVTEGLKYALHGEALINGERDGTSNETLSEAFSIRIGEGKLLVFIENEDTETSLGA